MRTAHVPALFASKRRVSLATRKAASLITAGALVLASCAPLSVLPISAFADAAPTPSVENTTTGTSYGSIQEAINAAATSSPESLVIDGQFDEDITIDRPLSITGTDANSIIDGSVTIASDNVTLDGVTIYGQANSPAISMTGGNSGETIKNTLIAIASGGSAASFDAHDVTFSNDKIVYNAGASGGIAANGSSGNLTFSGNDFSVSGGAGTAKGADISINGGTPPTSGVTISGNTSESGAGFLVLSNADNPTVSDNTIQGSKQNAAMYIGGGNTGVSITGNAITGTGTAIYVQTGGTPASVTIHDNQFDTTNDIGVMTDATAPLDATDNWWGDAFGPNDQTSGDGSNPDTNAGTGSQVIGEVNYSGWCTDCGTSGDQGGGTGTGDNGSGTGTGSTTPTQSSLNFVVHESDLATSGAAASSSPTSWFYYDDSTGAVDNSLGQFVTGPGVAPAGSGSAHFATATSSAVSLATYSFNGIPLSEITGLAYSTYRVSGSSSFAPSLEFDIDSDATDANASTTGRLVYEPYFTQTVQTGAWQAWDALDDSAGTGTGNWWFSDSGLAGASGCAQATPCTWAEVLAKYPHAAISGMTALKTGTWDSAYDGNADDFAITLNDGTNEIMSTFDFEPDAATAAPTSIAITNAADLASTTTEVGKSFAVNWSVGTTTATSTAPSGMVSVSINGVSGCSADVSAGGCSVTATSTGTASLVASYGGGAGFAPSESVIATHAITAASSGNGTGTGGGSSSGSGTTVGLGNAAPGTISLAGVPVAISVPGSVLGASTTTVSNETGAECSTPLLTDYLGIGRDNDPAQVRLLQYFLNSQLGTALPLTGFFGTATENAVDAFQLKYADQILAPWNIETPTGYVYKTTQRWINLTTCGALTIPLPQLP